MLTGNDITWTSKLQLNPNKLQRLFTVCTNWENFPIKYLNTQKLYRRMENRKSFINLSNQSLLNIPIKLFYSESLDSRLKSITSEELRAIYSENSFFSPSHKKKVSYHLFFWEAYYKNVILFFFRIMSLRFFKYSKFLRKILNMEHMGKNISFLIIFSRFVFI